jgi:hypothetical protein
MYSFFILLLHTCSFNKMPYATAFHTQSAIQAPQICLDLTTLHVLHKTGNICLIVTQVAFLQDGAMCK